LFLILLLSSNRHFPTTFYTYFTGGLILLCFELFSLIFILLINFLGVAFKTRLNAHKLIVDIKKRSKWQLILITIMIIMMHYWLGPTIYEQNRLEFMNKILIYFIVSNGYILEERDSLQSILDQRVSILWSRSL
jgi:hypothetical protein